MSGFASLPFCEALSLTEYINSENLGFAQVDCFPTFTFVFYSYTLFTVHTGIMCICCLFFLEFKMRVSLAESLLSAALVVVIVNASETHKHHSPWLTRKRILGVKSPGQYTSLA